MRFRNPFRRSVVKRGNQVVSCRHDHYQPWRNTILAETTTCGNFDCSAHRGTIYLVGKQCITPGCGVTWREQTNGKKPTIEWRERRFGGMGKALEAQLAMRAEVLSEWKELPERPALVLESKARDKKDGN